MTYRVVFPLMVLLLAASFIFSPLNALALDPAALGLGAASPSSTTATASAEAPVCTDFNGSKEEIYSGTFGGAYNASSPGILTEIDNYIKNIVSGPAGANGVRQGGATQKLFSAFTSNSGYRNAVFASMVLMVLFYGVGFTIGVVQASLGQVLIRLVKISIVATLVSPAGWSFFSTYVVGFFANGTDDIIRAMMSIGTGTNVGNNVSPFFQLDNLTKFLITPESIIAIIGSAFTGGPFGLTMSAMLLISFWTFVKLIIKALQTYAVCYVARALILGVAPIFFVFMLFSQTMSYFKSWVNVLFNLSLQPIMLFTFLSFFIVLIESASKDMLGFELCWGPTKLAVGAETPVSFWQFVEVKPDGTGQAMRGDMTWQGSPECLAKGGGDCKSFPINILDMLTFLILVYLADRFVEILKTMASELSNAFINVDAGGKIQEFLERSGQAAGTGAGGVQASGAGAPASGSGGNRSGTVGNNANTGRNTGGGGGGSTVGNRGQGAGTGPSGTNPGGNTTPRAGGGNSGAGGGGTGGGTAGGGNPPPPAGPRST